MILVVCVTVLAATPAVAQRDAPAFGDPTKMEKYHPDPSHLPPGYVPPEGGITDLQVMRQNKIEMAQRVEMSCSSADVFISYRTTIQRDNKYHINDPDNEYLFIVEGLTQVPEIGYKHNLMMEKVKGDTVYLRLQLMPPGPDEKSSLKMGEKIPFGGKIALGKNPVTKAVITIDYGNGQTASIKCRGKK